ncbi:MAG: hypothetical protein ACE5G8_01360 [Anaerolineae bacterium]
MPQPQPEAAAQNPPVPDPPIKDATEFDIEEVNPLMECYNG